MKMIYEKVAINLKGSSILPMAWIVFTAIIIVSGSMWWEDYMTSYYGYKAFPTQKATSVVVFVALLPQLIQSAAVYFAIGLSGTSKNERNLYGFDILPVSIGIWFAAFLLDGWWDYIYKSAPYATDGKLYIQGVIDSFGVYGFGSEFLLTISLAMWVSLTQNGAFTALIELLIQIAEMLGDAIALIVTAVRSIAKALVAPFQVDNSKNNKKPANGGRVIQNHNPKHNPKGNDRPRTISSNRSNDGIVRHIPNKK